MSRSKALFYYVLTRLLLAPLMLWTIATFVFLLMRATPGDPVDVALGPKAPEAAREAMRERLGLNVPIWVQYIRYIGDLLRLNLGVSLDNRPVVDIIQIHFPATVELAVCSMLVAALVGIGVGAIAASKPNTPVDAGGRLFGIISYAVPMYWFGMMLQLIFSVQLRWFPVGTRYPIQQSEPNGPTGLYLVDSLLHGQLGQFLTSIYHLTLPSLTLGLLLSGIFERIVRVNLKQTLKADYVEAARARGIPEKRIVAIHALKNALIPVITVLGLTFASLLGGAILTEVTFGWPGLARRLYEAITARDYAVVQGIVVFFAIIVAIASILIDILNAWVDPRIRY
ncbi:MAG: ABC transporter permease [Merismopedia sp. SIO2A8]|nr:ABC transporter permease [Merismopedia sp. SIO2A8]